MVYTSSPIDPSAWEEAGIDPELVCLSSNRFRVVGLGSSPLIILFNLIYDIHAILSKQKDILSRTNRDEVCLWKTPELRKDAHSPSP